MSSEAMSATAPPAPVLRMLGWCAGGVLILSAVLPELVPLVPARAPVTLEVRGAFDFLPPEAVRASVAGLLDRDFYELDLGALRREVERLPWVARARVERVWPATVRIEVVEHRPIARWGGAALLSDEGAVFSPGGVLPEGLPQLDGPPGRAAAVRAAFDVLRARLVDTPFVPARLQLGERGEWTAWTAAGIEIRLGRSPDGEAPLVAAATLAGPALRALEGRLEEVAYVDLHYIHGFAVGWREQPAGDAPAGAVAGEAIRHE